MNIRETIARELHAPARKNFPTRPVEVKGIFDLYQSDLIEMIPFAPVNEGYKYILTIINCFSKYAYGVPLKDKSAGSIVKALKPILEKNPMRFLQTDQGTEFFNASHKRLMKSFNIQHYATYSEKKASIIERFQRTLKSALYRKFTETGSYNWVKILPTIMRVYNNTKHRTIGMKPSEVNVENEAMVMNNINKNRQRYSVRDKKQRFKVGDKVRISKYRKVFDKGYLPNWTNEIFSIHSVGATIPITYTLKDYLNNILNGTFYDYELKKTLVGDVYLVEKVLRKKGEQVYVKWLGFDGTHNSWINKNELV